MISKCNFSNWMFLFFLRTNLSEFLFQKVIYHLASEFPSDPDRENDINDYKARGAAVVGGGGGAYPSLDTVDAPLLHHRAAAAVAGGSSPSPKIPADNVTLLV